MKKYLVLLVCMSFFACNNSPSAKDQNAKATKEYPDNVNKVMKAHGGLDLWNSMNSMSYEMPSKVGVEKQSIDLSDRRELIEKPTFRMGYDGENYWTTADTSVNVNPVFYKNLIFYFYAMPFVAADDGIKYEEVPALDFEGVSYPGFKISYESNIGISPEDEYFIHYSPETYQMEWLGYTVTYFSKEKSNIIGWRRYNDWVDVSGLKLPNSMLRMASKDNLPVSQKSKTDFKNMMVSKDDFEDGYFSMPEGARVVEE